MQSERLAGNVLEPRHDVEDAGRNARLHGQFRKAQGRQRRELGRFDDVVNNIRWYTEAIDKVFGKISPTGEGNLGPIVREPVGVVGMVLPSNFPAGTVS
ncbi:aldehyde dehydrogenase family protein [Mesorhizobium sp. M1A.F.Ca.ET.072.01.1.1]|uniref:aldehyde dehydrogenase family protein n=1 Tax=unclassified Mesorhizobium TaxID=325217 RepID=UPI001AED1194